MGVLVSPSANLAFAHFPKTAGKSLAVFFKEALPDARWIDPADPHVGVCEGFQRLRWRSRPLRRWSARLKGVQVKPCDVLVTSPEALRVIGVVREPFEMAVSLFEYWNRKITEQKKDHSPLINAAFRGDYIGFLRILSGDESLFPTYRQFFDVGGPLWPRTILVDFGHLRDGLDEAFASLGVKVDIDRLARMNDSQRPDGAMRRREAEAGELADAIRRRYAWGFPLKLHGRPALGHGGPTADVPLA